MKTKKIHWRRGRPPAARLSQPDVPYLMKLPDGRVLMVEVPDRWTAADVGGTAFTPEGVKFLDQARALAMKTPTAPSPGYLTRLREALGLTQQALAQKLGTGAMTVARWEWGRARPRPQTLHRLMELRNQAVHQGVVLAG